MTGESIALFAVSQVVATIVGMIAVRRPLTATLLGFVAAGLGLAALSIATP
jgi:hypothetical protein